MTEVLSRSGLPDASEWHPFHHISLGHLLPGIAPDAAMGHPDDAHAFLKAQLSEFEALPQSVPPDRETFRYAPGKWSVRELVGHLADAERVFGYRMLSIARGSSLALPGFDEDAYVAAAESDRQELPSLVSEFTMLREANLRLLRTVPDAAWDLRAEVNGRSVSLRAVAWFAASHLRHHLGVLEERYLRP